MSIGSTHGSSTDIGRRHLLRMGGATLALGCASEGARAAATRSISRTRFGIAADTYLPEADVAYVLPFSRVFYSDSTDCTLQADNTVRINTPGLYRVCVSCDWPAQWGVDIDLRTYGTRLRPAGTGRPFAVVPNDLTPVPDTDTYLATVDVPGSDPPQVVRWQGAWTPGLIALGGIASLDVTLPVAGIIGMGDLVFASLTSIADATIGVDATSALIVTGKPTGPNTVRITIYNPVIAAGVNVPAGTLQVVAMSSVNTRGESADAWMVLQSTTETFAAGDLVYGVFRSKTQGDFLQESLSTFLQIERWA